jgi:hypothetical protein
VVGFLNFRMQRRSFDLMRSSQITDRFAKAIEQLGSNSRAIRIGGIYALEQVVRDAPKEEQRDVASDIVSALSNFVRESQPAPPKKVRGYVQMLKVRAPDVQVAMTVLGRSPLCDERLKPDSKELLDLSRTDLRRASLSGAHLERVNLWRTRLDGANLQGAHLQGAVLEEASLGRFDPQSERYKDGADLSGADLTGAQLNGVKDLKEAKTSNGTLGLPG